MPQVILSLLNSRKALVTFACVFAAALGVVFGKLSTDQAAGLVAILCPALVLAIAAEDVAKTLAPLPAAPSVAVEVNNRQPSTPAVTQEQPLPVPVPGELAYPAPEGVEVSKAPLRRVGEVSTRRPKGPSGHKTVLYAH